MNTCVVEARFKHDLSELCHPPRFVATPRVFRLLFNASREPHQRHCFFTVSDGIETTSSAFIFTKSTLIVFSLRGLFSLLVSPCLTLKKPDEINIRNVKITRVFVHTRLLIACVSICPYPTRWSLHSNVIIFNYICCTIYNTV